MELLYRGDHDTKSHDVAPDIREISRIKRRKDLS